MTFQRHLRSPLLAGLLCAAAAFPLVPLPARAISASDEPAVAAPPADPSAAPVAPLPQVQPRPTNVALLPPLPPATPRIFAITPERRALLNTIRFAEGTWAEGREVGYRIMFGGGLMPSLERHPDRVVRSARYASAAAGAYQFMPFTWSMVTRALRLEGFGPDAQDQGALFLIQRRGALAMADQGSFTPQLAARLAPEWASFPTLAGHSYYGQPVKRYDHLRRFYEANLAALRALEGQNLAATPEPLPQP